MLPHPEDFIDRLYSVAFEVATLMRRHAVLAATETARMEHSVAAETARLISDESPRALAEKERDLAAALHKCDAMQSALRRDLRDRRFALARRCRALLAPVGGSSALEHVPPVAMPLFSAVPVRDGDLRTLTFDCRLDPAGAPVLRGCTVDVAPMTKLATAVAWGAFSPLPSASVPPLSAGTSPVGGQLATSSATALPDAAGAVTPDAARRLTAQLLTELRAAAVGGREERVLLYWGTAEDFGRDVLDPIRDQRLDLWPEAAPRDTLDASERLLDVVASVERRPDVWGASVALRVEPGTDPVAAAAVLREVCAHCVGAWAAQHLTVAFSGTALSRCARGAAAASKSAAETAADFVSVVVAEMRQTILELSTLRRPVALTAFDTFASVMGGAVPPRLKGRIRPNTTVFLPDAVLTPHMLQRVCESVDASVIPAAAG